ncbi:MAG: GNAT family N-acetyltransferase [Gammaproteobacteria bacterium]|nr:GNAT family N-acetyltransferase [Gammaproteobacteria bacterium]MBT3724756.1 GNAT family N-acetyltransferase [Gammaproteobacteria bacterium]MBT4195495.1 GNAT family N-acetyltransferase [Gammaproteobacteria bacterium]MBT4448783.1 GNAT family N-acetyltransferase [Gammaproteobacteria bacterium]MBT4860635.1 GNAT family N-acetyltransferase [Gammaproteobacteria bacterium]
MRRSEYIDIRTAIESDLDAICILSDQTNAFHHDNSPNVFSLPANSDRDRIFWIEILEDESSVFFVIEDVDKVQGFITAKIIENTVIPFLVRKRVCRIGTIVVADTCQRKGMGKALMQKIEQWAQAEKVDDIRLEVMEFNKNAQKFYELLGFRVHSQNLSKTIV